MINLSPELTERDKNATTLSQRTCRWIVLCCLLTACVSCAGNTPVRGVDGEIRWIDVVGGQLKTKLYKSNTLSENPVFVVVLHGDGGSGRPPSSQYKLAQGIAEGFDKLEMPERLRRIMGDPITFHDVVAVGILRPGYTDRDGDTSDGRMGKRTGDNHTARVTEAVATVVEAYKREFMPRAVILIGHSGGATISSNILALHPEVADAGLLVGCGCDMKASRARLYEITGHKGFTEPTTSLDPMDYAHLISAEKKVRLVVGENDDRTFPEDMYRYAGVLEANGVDVAVTVVAGRDHNDILVDPQVFSYLDELVRAY